MEKHTQIAVRNGAILAALALLVIGVVGYRLTRDPLDAQVMAATPSEFQASRLNLEDRLTAEQKAEFDAAIEELKLRAMGMEHVSGADWVELQVCGVVDGRTVRDVIEEGFNWKATRLGSELTELQASQDRNRRLRTKPGDAASRDYLDHFDARLSARIEQTRHELADTRKLLASAAN